MRTAYQQQREHIWSDNAGPGLGKAKQSGATNNLFHRKGSKTNKLVRLSLSLAYPVLPTPG
jgi:hypothetical protein